MGISFAGTPGATSFVQLSDAPSSLSGQSGRFMIVDTPGGGTKLIPSAIYENANGLNVPVPLLGTATATVTVSSGDALRGIAETASGSDGVFGQSSGTTGDGVHGVGDGPATGVHAIATGTGTALLAEGYGGGVANFGHIGTLAANHTAAVLQLRRSVNLNGHTATGPMLDITDSTAGGSARLIKAVKAGADMLVAYNDGRLWAAGKVLAQGGLGVGNAVLASVLGNVVRKMEVFDAGGNSLGYVPIYNSIT